MKGTFITFEGCEGVGKSTQLDMLHDYLRRTKQEAIFTREPGGTSISEQIRKIIMSIGNKEMHPLTEALLYAASRAQHVNEVIRPALNAGKIVICDRFIDSSIAYQGCARGLGIELVRQINAPAIEDCIPDITIFIDLSPADAFRTVKKTDRLEQENSDFHSMVYRAYVNEAEKSNGRVIKIEPCQNKVDTHNKILNALKAKGVFK
ncbi:MAG TPA: dTMP kinase [Clostridia bacterium]|nr:dTMP kinase [Clostridia bacterium]